VLLRQLGYDDLVEPIMSLGGPLEVGKLMGLDWTPRKQMFDERLRPKRVDSYALDIAGSLLLGMLFMTMRRVMAMMMNCRSSSS